MDSLHLILILASRDDEDSFQEEGDKKSFLTRNFESGFYFEVVEYQFFHFDLEDPFLPPLLILLMFISARPPNDVFRIRIPMNQLVILLLLTPSPSWDDLYTPAIQFETSSHQNQVGIGYIYIITGIICGESIEWYILLFHIE